jgi:membrane fusion protein (multidrug efflux system)
MKPWQKWPGLILAFLLLAGCQQGEKQEEESAENESVDEVEEEQEAPAIPVETSIAKRGDIFASYSGTAPVEAFADATVIAKVGGEVRKIYVEEGDDVKSGQILARLDGDRLRLEQAQTQANLAKLQRDYDRNVDLIDRGLISAGELEKLRFEMEALEATNKLAELQLSYADIRAPIDGVVAERFIKVGNTLNIEAQTFQITSFEPLVSYLHVPEREFRRIAAGQEAMLIIDALGGTAFPAKVARVSPIVDPTTGTFKITIEVSDPTRQLKPGMFARIGIIYDTHTNALQVPRSALIDEVGTTSIFVVEDQVAHRREVEIGFTSAGFVEIVSGLTDSDTFVAIGQSGLKEGSKVVVINSEGTPESSASNESDDNPDDGVEK